MKTYFFICSVLLLLFTGCQHYYYLPNNLNIPAMTHQHDASVMLATGKSNCKQVQLSYSPLKHVGLMYNGIKVRDGNTTGGMQEGGLGLYYGIGNDVSFGLYGGWGQGWEHHSYSITNYNSNTYYTSYQTIYADLKFQRKFIQPCFSYQGKWIQAAGGLRFSNLSFTTGNIDVRITSDPTESYALDQLQRKSPFHLTEAGLSLGLRVHAFTLGVQYVYLDDSESHHNLFVSKNLSFAATIQLNDFWRPRWSPKEETAQKQ